MCSLERFAELCSTIWADLVAETPIPPAGLRGIYARAFAGWAGADPEPMVGDADLSFSGPAGGELWAGRAGWECYYSYSSPDGHRLGPCHTYGGGYVVTVQPNDGAGTLTISASETSLPAEGGSVTFEAAASDGSTPTDLSWSYVPDAAAPNTAPRPAASGSPDRSAAVRAAIERGMGLMPGPDGQLVPASPTAQGLIFIDHGTAATLGVSRGSAHGSALAPTVPSRVGSADASRCSGQLQCTITIRQTGSMMVWARVNGVDYTAAARIGVGTAGGGGDSGSNPRISVESAAGPNGGSFVSGDVVRLVAGIDPDSLASAVRWEISDDPRDRVQTVLPNEVLPGASSGFVVPPQPTTRWMLYEHPGELEQKTLGFEVRAVIRVRDRVTRSEPAYVSQTEADVLRQEYLDFGVPMPPAENLFTQPFDLAHFTWDELNGGDYDVAYFNPPLLARLSALRNSLGEPVVLTSGFRNPVHQRFHIRVSGGGAPSPTSNHQYGNAVDIRTGRNLDQWDRIADHARDLGFCVEPIAQSTLDHVHIDWRGGRSRCPPGW